MPTVSQLMNDVHDGTLVLPDFQRSFIWEPEDVRELIVSVLGDYFIGSMLVLEQYKDDSPFALRLVEGMDKINPQVNIQSIVKILLDGQQRTSALYYALFEPDLPLKNRKSSYRFFLDIDKAIKKDFDGAVIAVSVSDKRRLNEIEKNGRIIPLRLVRDIGALVVKFKEDSEVNNIVNLANEFMKREVNIVTLPRKTDLDKIVETFERINRTGEPLSIFELLTARLYKEKIKIRDLFEKAKNTYIFPNIVPPEFILRTISLLRDKEPKRKSVLELDPKDFEADWERACQALHIAFERTTDIKNGYGVLDFKKWMPYSPMLVPLASIIDFVKTNSLETDKNYAKIDRWYWISVFSNHYDQAQDTTSYQDFIALKEWINDDTKTPKIVQDFKPENLDFEIANQSNAIYRGVMNLVILKGALDFATGQAPQFDKEKIQDDHIFPKSLYNYHYIPNRTLISTNLKKWKTKPSEYFKEKLTEHGEEKLKSILESHLIPSDALDELLSDDLDKFVEKRKQAIINELKQRLTIS